MAKIIVRRSKAWWQDRARKYVVLINGKEVANVPNGGQLELPVEPGTHTVRMKIDWCGSREFNVDVGAEESVTLECGPNASPFSAFFYITMWKDKYIWLRRGVKEAQIG